MNELPRVLTKEWMNPHQALGCDGWHGLCPSLDYLRKTIADGQSKWLLLEDVQRLAARKLTGRTDLEIVEAHCRRLRDDATFDTIERLAWTDSSRSRPAGSIQGYVETTRSARAEIDAIRALRQVGLEFDAAAARKPPGDGVCDWTLPLHQSDLDVEVFSMAEDDEWIDIIESAMKGVLLISTTDRPIDVNFAVSNEDDARRSERPDRQPIDSLLGLVWDNRGLLIESLHARMERGDWKQAQLGLALRSSAGDVQASMSGACGLAEVEFNFPKSVNLRMNFEPSPDLSLMQRVLHSQRSQRTRYLPTGGEPELLSDLKLRMQRKVQGKATIVRKRRETERAQGRDDVIAIDLGAPWNWSLSVGDEKSVLDHVYDDGRTFVEALADAAEASTQGTSGDCVPCVAFCVPWCGPLRAGASAMLRRTVSLGA